MARNGNFRWMKWLIILVVVGSFIAGGAWYFLGRDKSTPQYQTATVARGDITQAVTATGQLNPVTNVTVGSQISGMIQKLYADFNSRVKAGEVVAELDPATYKAILAQSEGELANARANLELAKVEADRAIELFKNKLISQSEHDRVLATLHQAEAQVKIREGSLLKSQVDLSRCTIYAPVDGIVISRNVDVGQTVAASLSAPTIFVIANDLTQMQIDANVAEADIGGVEDGQEVNFTVDAFPYRNFRGEVRQVRNAPLTVQNVVSYDTVITVNNPDMKLKPGMTANVSIVIAQRSGALKIPNAALRFRLPETVAAEAKTNTPQVAANSPRRGGGEGGGPEGQGGGRRRGEGGGRGPGGGGNRPRPERQMARTVYVLPKGEADAKPTPVQIRLGITDGAMTEVLEGLNEGDQVITGMLAGSSESTPGSRPGNPFGGGGGGFRRF